MASFSPNPKRNSFVEQTFTEHLLGARPQDNAEEMRKDCLLMALYALLM